MNSYLRRNKFNDNAYGNNDSCFCPNCGFKAQHTLIKEKNTYYIDKSMCRGYGLCVETCRFNAIQQKSIS